MLELSLFSGAGGGLLAARFLGWRTVGYVEHKDYCQSVLAARIADGLLPEAPIFGDIQAFIGQGYAFRYRGVVDVVSAGFPCQPFSSAGSKRGPDDPRNMWPQTAAVLHMVRPRFAFLENVPGLLAGSHGYFGHVLGELAEMGFDVRWCVLGASDVGAPHLRKRLWVLAYTDRERCQREPGDSQGGRTQKDQPSLSGEASNTNGWRQQVVSKFDGETQQATTDRDPRWRYSHGLRDQVADAVSEGQQNSQGGSSRARSPGGRVSADCGWWDTEPAVGRVAHGVAHRVDRLRALGNGQVPAVAAAAWRILYRSMNNA